VLKVSILYAVIVCGLSVLICNEKKCIPRRALKETKIERAFGIQVSGNRMFMDSKGLSDQSIEVCHVRTVAGKFAEDH